MPQGPLVPMQVRVAPLTGRAPDSPPHWDGGVRPAEDFPSYDRSLGPYRDQSLCPSALALAWRPVTSGSLASEGYAGQTVASKLRVHKARRRQAAWP